MDYSPLIHAEAAEAGALLARQVSRNRRARPELAARFEAPAIATRAIEGLLNRAGARGLAARRNGELRAYLIGETSQQAWGRCGYLYLPGCGLAEDERPETIQDLYAQLGESWNQAGCFNHYVYLSAADQPLIEAWFNLGFGKERVDALLDLRGVTFPEVESPPGIIIRRAGKDDGPHLASLSDTIWRQQSGAPRWHPMPPEEAAKQAPGWAEIAETESDLAYLAFDGQTAVGSLAFYLEPESDTDLTVPPACRYLTAAATRAAARGRGISTALTWNGLKEIRAAGADFCLTNWQSANLLAARFWPRFGFQPVAFRLARRVNEMIAWAK